MGGGGQQAHSEVRKCAICISFICGEKCEKCARARESISISIPISLFMCVCVYEWYLSIYPQIQTNLTVRSGKRELLKVAKRKTEKNITKFSLSLAQNGIEKEFLLEIIAQFAVSRTLHLPLSLSHTLSVSLFTKTELFPFLMPVKVEES